MKKKEKSYRQILAALNGLLIRYLIRLFFLLYLLPETDIQGDTARWFKPPVDIRTKVPIWPGQVRAGQATTELLI